MLALMLCVAGCLGYLIYERVRLSRWRGSIPILIAVTGTRGKSSVARMLAAVLRAEDRKVLAKTTGSMPCLLWPDGTETEIKRRGPASILEQKRLLKHASEIGADIVVAEVMSIHPENHQVETGKILKPDIVVVTNTWPDHVAALGHTEADIASALSLDVHDGTTVFAASVCHPHLLERAAQAGAKEIVTVDGGESAPESELGETEFCDNIQLVYAVSRHLGMKDDDIRRNLAGVGHDIGHFSIKQLRENTAAGRHYAANAFAANDPVSTIRILDKVTYRFSDCLPKLVGLLCLRSDRGDRTVQWIDALRGGLAGRFDRLFVTGGHASVVARRVPEARVLKMQPADRLTKAALAGLESEAVVFGFGNIGGVGRELIEYWNGSAVENGL